MDFTILLDHHTVIIDEREKIDEYLEHCRKLKRLWNMKEILISVVDGALGMSLKSQKRV